jgi:hypothetical protein
MGHEWSSGIGIENSDLSSNKASRDSLCVMESASLQLVGGLRGKSAVSTIFGANLI